MAHTTGECSPNGDAQMHTSEADPSTDDSVLIRLEVQQAATSAVSPKVISERVRQLLSTRRLQYKDGVIPFTAEDDHTLADNIRAICIVDTEMDQEASQGTHLLFWQVWTTHCIQFPVEPLHKSVRETSDEKDQVPAGLEQVACACRCILRSTCFS